jgi:hypothetical protein
MDGAHRNPFERLEPPRDGLSRLRARLERDRRRTRSRRAALGVTTILLCCGLAWIALRPEAVRERATAPDPFRLARIGLGLEPPPAEPLTLPPEERGRAAVRRVPLSDERVLFYLVETLE